VGLTENWKPVRGLKGIECSTEGKFRTSNEDDTDWTHDLKADMVAKAWLGMKKNQRIVFRDGDTTNWAVSNLQLQSFIVVSKQTKLEQHEITKEIAEQVLRYEPDTGRFMAKKTSKAGVVTWVHAGEIGTYYMIKLCGRVYGAQALAVLFMTGRWPHGEVGVKNQNWGDARWVNVLVKNK
jgi:hypothetical protein